MDNLEPQWLKLAKSGDVNAYTNLVDAFQRPVYNLCYRMLGDIYEAEDAAQETFFRAYHNIKKYDDDRPFSTWLLSIAAHFCIDQIRKRRIKLISLDETPFLEPPDTNPGPEASLGRQEEQKRVQDLLDTLKPQDRAAVVMFYWYEFSYEEISEALGLSLSAVKSRLHRARLSLAESWTLQESKSTNSERTSNEQAQSPAFQ